MNLKIKTVGMFQFSASKAMEVQTLLKSEKFEQAFDSIPDVKGSDKFESQELPDRLVTIKNGRGIFANPTTGTVAKFLIEGVA